MKFRMSNKMRDLRAKIDEQMKLMNAAIEKEDTEAAESAKAELDKLNQLYDVAEAEFAARRKLGLDTEDGDGSGEGEGDDGEKEYNAKLFYKALCRQSLTDSEKTLVDGARSIYNNRYSETSKENGGITVPEDLSTEIFESIKSTESVRNLVGVENVNSASGTRIFRNGEAIKLYNTAEAEEIREMTNKAYGTVGYNQKKFAGLMVVSNELMEDSFVNFKNEIISYFAEAARYTENAQVFYGAGGEKHCQGMLSTSGAYKEVVCDELTIEFLRAIYLSLPSGYRVNAKWIMNSLAFATVSALKFEDGRSCIQPDPRNEDTYKLLGYTIEIYDSIETEDDKTVIAFGDFKRGYRMFPRKDLGIAFTDTGAGAFETDSIKARATERFDGKVFDRDAIVIAREIPVAALAFEGGNEPLSNEMSEASLKNLTKAQLLEVAADLGVDGVTTTNTKDDIVTAILLAVE